MGGTPVRTRIVCMLAASLPLLGSAQAATPGDNDSALQAWTDATGESAPTLVTDADGTTRLNWAAASVDLYHREVAGGSLLTPFASGSFQRGTFEGGTETATTAGSKTWARVAVTESNDRALLRQPVQLNQLQFGRTDGVHRVDLGDMVLAHSTLSANTPFKGLRWQGSFESIRLSAAAGGISESWEALGDPTQRTQRLREALSVKAEQSVGAVGTVYATLQGYGDSGELPLETVATARTRGQSTTVGANLVRGELALQAEAGWSHAALEGQAAESARAFILDATWTRRSLTLRTGVHDFGPRYASLSASALPGLRESYANAAWQANAWSTWTADLRRTVDRSAVSLAAAQLQLPGYTTAGASTAATLQWNARLPQLPGAVLTLAGSQSRGQGVDGTPSDRSSASATVALTRGSWTTQATLQRGRTSADASLGASTLEGLSATVGRSWGTNANAWNGSASVTGQHQEQRFASGPRSMSRSIGLQLSASHPDRGTLAARVDVGSGRDTTGRPLALRNLRLDLDRPLRRNLAMKVYAAWAGNYPDVPELAYRERIVGVQFTYQF